MEHKTFFEALLQKHHIAVERYIHFRIPDSHDADDEAPGIEHIASDDQDHQEGRHDQSR